MSIYSGNSVRVRERTFNLGRMGYVVKCEECEWYSTAALCEDHAREIEVNHYRVVHPGLHPDKVWANFGVKA